MGTNLIRAMLLASASATVAITATPTAAYAQEASYQIDIPSQSMGDALRALGKATKQNIVFNGSIVKGKRSAAVRGRMSAGDALAQMLAGSGLKMSRGSGGGLVVVQGGNVAAASPGTGEAIAGSAAADNDESAEIVVTGTNIRGGISRESGMADSINDQLTGHAPRTVGCRYGAGVDRHGLAEAVSRLDFEFINWEPILRAVTASD